MSIYETILKRRTIRKFKQAAIPDLVLEKLVNAGHVSPSGGNMQPLEYIIVRNQELLEAVFKHLKWAAYIVPEGVPKENEKPAAYIIIIANKNPGSTSTSYDLGAAAMSILLTAWEDGLGGCWIKAFDKSGLKKLLGVSDIFEVDSVIALGYRDEAPVREESDTEIKYWKDPKGVMHVPKKRVRTVTHWEQF